MAPVGRPLVVVDAPSNLGLRPPEPGSVPGCSKAPWALRDRGLLARLGAEDGGVVVPPRYRSEWTPGEGDRNGDAIAAYSLALADRVGEWIDRRRRVVVLGGDCSILVGTTLALRRRGRSGVVYLDAHSDFRHPGNASAIGAAGGEALAIVTGRGDPRLVDVGGLAPLVRHADAYLVGVRDDDEYLDEVQAPGIGVASARRLVEVGPDAIAADVTSSLQGASDGFWVHFDVDVVDASEIDAVDCPEPNGPSLETVTALLHSLAASPAFVGLEVTILDPDLDPAGEQAARVADALVAALGR